MGYSGWDDSGGRGRAPRDERSGNRSYDRAPRGGSNGRGYERADRASTRGYDDRGPGASSGSRWRGPSADDGYDRPRQRPPRDGYDGRGDRGNDRPDRSMRGARAPVRDDDRDARPRRGPSPGAGPGGSNPRNRPPARPAWDDVDEPPRRRRSDRGDARGRGAEMRDPRALRRGLVPDDVEDEEEDDEDSGSPFGKAILIIFVAFLLGIGGAYGYFRVSTPVPTPQAGAATPASSPTTSPTPKTTPTAAPTSAATPTTLTPASGSFLVMLPARAS
ncbi:MAG TPA: hypothetical protein VLJ14_15990 [Ktedonobacterales bacterium]|nr:hypothetical protein [Ktedonobacterales bacterium]